MKKLYKILIAILIALSVCGNLYYFGNQEYQKKLLDSYNQGVSDAGLYIYDSIEKNGSITIQNGEDEMILFQRN